MTPAAVPLVVESEAVTVGELGRNLAKFEKTVTDSLAVIGSKLDERPDWKDVRSIEAQLVERIKRLEEWQTWAVRLVVGAVILAVIALVTTSKL